jgi:3-oxoacyl-[acyl-carrier protein] reductase
VAICAGTASTLEEAAAHIHKTTGHKVFHKAMDVTDSTAVAAFDAAVEARFGRVDICVTNSGGPPSNMFKNTKPEDWRSAFDQLLMSNISFAKETLPRMQKNKWGRLIPITSSAVIAVDGGLVRSLL